MDQVKRFQAGFMGLPTRAKRAIVAVAAVTVVIMVFVLHASTSTSWVPVESGIRAENVSNIQNTLGSAKIDSKVGDGGSTVMVPSSSASAARTALANAGILAGPSGGGDPDPYKPFGTPSKYGMTSDQEAIQKQRLTETKIQNQVDGLPNVDGSEVNIVTPDASPFSDDSNKATAAVSVDTGGSGLTQSEAKTIAQLTAYSVEGLKPTDVDVSDDTGATFLGGSSDDSSGAGSDISAAQAKIQLESMYDNSVKQELSSLLTPMVGPNNFVVSANADLDVDTVKTEEDNFGGSQGKQGPMDTEQSQTEQLKGNPQGTPAAGVAGTASNVGTTQPQYAAQTGTSSSSNQNYTDVIKDAKFDNDEFRQDIEKAPGGVNSENISVIVNDKGLSGSQKSAIQSAVTKFAAKSSGDTPSVTFAKLKSASQKAPGSGVTGGLSRLGHNLTWLWALLALGAFGLFVRKQLNERTAELLSAPRQPLLLGAGAGSFEPVSLKELEAAVNAAGTLETQKRQDLQSKVEKIAESKPQDVAVQLRGWLHEDRR